MSVGLPSCIFCIVGTVSMPAYVPSQYTAFVFVFRCLCAFVDMGTLYKSIYADRVQ